MFIASECYNGTIGGTSLCVLDTEDCTVERISVHDVSTFLDNKSLKIRNMIKHPVTKLWQVADNRMIRGNLLSKSDDFVTCKDDCDSKYILNIGSRSPIELDFSTKGLKVNKMRISNAESFEILYFFLYKDYVVFRCRRLNYVQNKCLFCTVIVDKFGKVDFYEADLTKVKNKVTALKIELSTNNV